MVPHTTSGGAAIRYEAVSRRRAVASAYYSHRLAEHRRGQPAAPTARRSCRSSWFSSATDAHCAAPHLPAPASVAALPLRPRPPLRCCHRSTPAPSAPVHRCCRCRRRPPQLRRRLPQRRCQAGLLAQRCVRHGVCRGVDCRLSPAVASLCRQPLRCGRRRPCQRRRLHVSPKILQSGRAGMRDAPSGQCVDGDQLHEEPVTLVTRLW